MNEIANVIAHSAYSHGTPLCRGTGFSSTFANSGAEIPGEESIFRATSSLVFITVEGGKRSVFGNWSAEIFEGGTIFGRRVKSSASIHELKEDRKAYSRVRSF